MNAYANTINFAAIRPEFFGEIAIGSLETLDAPHLIPAGSCVSWAGGFGDVRVERAGTHAEQDDAFASFFDAA